MHAIIWMHITPKQFIQTQRGWERYCSNRWVCDDELRTDVDWSMVEACLGEPETDHESPTIIGWSYGLSKGR